MYKHAWIRLFMSALVSWWGFTMFYQMLPYISRRIGEGFLGPVVFDSVFAAAGLAIGLYSGWYALVEVYGFFRKKP